MTATIQSHVCVHCNAALSDDDRRGGWCGNCGKRLLPAQLPQTSRQGAQSGAEPPAGDDGPTLQADGYLDRPWLPSQLVAVCWLFGPLACGAVAGVNFARMGKRAYLVPCVLAGAALFAVEALVLMFLGGSVQQLRLPALLMNLAVGLGFMFAHQPHFAEWKEESWVPRTPDERYRPTRVGLLFLIALGCAAVQVGIIFLALSLTGSL